MLVQSELLTWLDGILISNHLKPMIQSLSVLLMPHPLHITNTVVCFGTRLLSLLACLKNPANFFLALPAFRHRRGWRRSRSCCRRGWRRSAKSEIEEHQAWMRMARTPDLRQSFERQALDIYG